MKKIRGLTLIELVVVVAVIGILAAVAYPSYQSHIRKSRRTEALTLLQAAQLAQEIYRGTHDSYAGSAAFSDPAFANICRNGQTSPCLSQNGYYELTATDPTGTGYTLTATPQAGTSQHSDTACKPITASKTATSTTFAPAACWVK